MSWTDIWKMILCGMFVCCCGCDLLDRVAPVPSIESYSDRDLAEELVGRGFSGLEDLLGDLFDGDDDD